MLTFHLRSAGLARSLRGDTCSHRAGKCVITATISGQGQLQRLRDLHFRTAAGGKNTMMNDSWRKLVAALFFGFITYIASSAALAATGSLTQQQVELDHVIPREKWAGTGLDKLTAAEQQTLADEITGLLGAGRSTQSSTPAGKDKSQWRMLHRRMSKDEVSKLLGQPDRVSVSRFYESWDYSGGGVTFDGKGRVDSWSER
jgi:hypothetical protein